MDLKGTHKPLIHPPLRLLSKDRGLFFGTRDFVRADRIAILRLLVFRTFESGQSAHGRLAEARVVRF